MDFYLKEISKLNTLTPEQEKKLWIKYKNEGEIDARQEIITSYQPLVYKMAKQYSTNNNIFMDLIQEGNIGLIDAADSFDHERGIRFSTFAVYHIRGRIIDALENDFCGLIYPGHTSYEYLESKVEEKIAVDKIKQILKELPLKERNIIEGIYILDKKAEAIAVELGISLSYVYRLQKKAIRRLRGKLANFIKNWK
ncbi:MAG: sigma-70 family RNA polymerase sigma factor [Halanaerobiaceae bacterium]